MNFYKSILISITAIILISCNLSAETFVSAPDFTLTDIKGNKVALSSLKGKVVFVDFWATWCPPCRASIPKVEGLYEKYKKKDIVFLGINLEGNSDSLRSFVSKNSMKYTVLFDDKKTSSAYGVRGIPSFFIINKEGQIAESFVGYEPGMEEMWENIVVKLLNENIKVNIAPSKKLTK